jgi:NADH-quinone oxidoreductase subunit M
LFFFHYWLPKAHVESISLGSIILAAVLLKMGSFGILIFSIIMKSYFNLQLITFLVFILSIGFVLRNFFILRQLDFKKIIAYFSISHITL